MLNLLLVKCFRVAISIVFKVLIALFFPKWMFLLSSILKQKFHMFSSIKVLKLKLRRVIRQKKTWILRKIKEVREWERGREGREEMTQEEEKAWVQYITQSLLGGMLSLRCPWDTQVETFSWNLSTWAQNSLGWRYTFRNHQHPADS